MSVDDSRLRDAESHPSDMASCGNLAANGNTFRLHYGHESELNACVLDNLGPADRLLWASVFSALPDAVRQAAAKDDVAAGLDKLLEQKVAQK
jgi:hypothetical protein